MEEERQHHHHQQHQQQKKTTSTVLFFYEMLKEVVSHANSVNQCCAGINHLHSDLSDYEKYLKTFNKKAIVKQLKGNIKRLNKAKRKLVKLKIEHEKPNGK